MVEENKWIDTCTYSQNINGNCNRRFSSLRYTTLHFFFCGTLIYIPCVGVYAHVVTCDGIWLCSLHRMEIYKYVIYIVSYTENKPLNS